MEAGEVARKKNEGQCRAATAFRRSALRAGPGLKRLKCAPACGRLVGQKEGKQGAVPSAGYRRFRRSEGVIAYWRTQLVPSSNFIGYRCLPRSEHVFRGVAPNVPSKNWLRTHMHACLRSAGYPHRIFQLENSSNWVHWVQRNQTPALTRHYACTQWILRWVQHCRGVPPIPGLTRDCACTQHWVHGSDDGSLPTS